MRSKTLVAALASALLCGAAPARAESHSGVQEYKLRNGMKVLVRPDHRAPVAVVQVWYKVGSADEQSGTTGISHMLEHMMFKGTKRYPAGQFSAIIAANGGEENAFTSNDYTAYYELLEKSRLKIALELEADRMRNLILAEDAFLKEREVVKEERRLRTDDDPDSLTYEQLYATAFNHSPYHHPIIGWMSDLDNLTINQVRHWYKTWYAPNNATLVVVGDVEPDAIYKLVQHYFDDLKPQPLPERRGRAQEPQRGQRRAVVKAPAEVPYLLMGYKTPALLTSRHEWEPYALAVAAGVLDAGESSRLSARLVRDKQLAASAGAGYDPDTRYQDLFLLDGTPANGHTVAELERALYQEIEALRAQLIPAAELERTKAQVVAAEVYSQDSMMTKATRLGALETVGLGWKTDQRYIERIKAVTPEQVRAVARIYLIDDYKTVAILEPQALTAAGKKSAGAAPPSGEMQ